MRVKNHRRKASAPLYRLLTAGLAAAVEGRHSHLSIRVAPHGCLCSYLYSFSP